VLRPLFSTKASNWAKSNNAKKQQLGKIKQRKKTCNSEIAFRSEASIDSQHCVKVQLSQIIVRSEERQLQTEQRQLAVGWHKANAVQQHKSATTH